MAALVFVRDWLGVLGCGGFEGVALTHGLGDWLDLAKSAQTRGLF